MVVIIHLYLELGRGAPLTIIFIVEMCMLHQMRIKIILSSIMLFALGCSLPATSHADVLSVLNQDYSSRGSRAKSKKAPEPVKPLVATVVSAAPIQEIKKVEVVEPEVKVVKKKKKKKKKHTFELGE